MRCLYGSNSLSIECWNKNVWQGMSQEFGVNYIVYGAKKNELKLPVVRSSETFKLYKIDAS
jgi:hypothetical protein